MAWVAALVAAAYQGYQSHSQNQQAKAANSRNAALFGNQGPDYVGNALAGRAGGNQFQQDLTGLAQGKNFNPYALNAPLAIINQGANNNMQTVASQIGRSNMSGGLANAYALANQTSRQGNIANTFQQYGLWKEGQRRSDLNWLMGLRQQGINNQLEIGNQLANRYQERTPAVLNALGAGWGTWAGSEQGKNWLNQGNAIPKSQSGVQGAPWDTNQRMRNYWEPN